MPKVATQIEGINSPTQQASPPLASFSLADVADLEQATDPMSTLGMVQIVEYARR